MNDLEQFFDNVKRELVRARTKFPANDFLVAALTEETGELANALLEHEYKNQPAVGVYAEAIQVCAVAIRIAFEGSAEFSYRFDAIDPKLNQAYFSELTKLNNSETAIDDPATVICANCGGDLIENGLCARCGNQFFAIRRIADREIGKLRDRVSPIETVAGVVYHTPPDVPFHARQCANCKRDFTGPAVLDARNTFCGISCQTAFEYKPEQGSADLRPTQ